MLTRSKRHLIVAGVAATALLLAAACAPQVSKVSWVECRWATLEAAPDPRGTYDRAALLIPVSIGGAEAFMQLDTGAVYSELYKDAADRLGLRYEIAAEIPEWPPEQGRAWRAIVRDFRFSDLRLARTEMLLVETPDDPARVEVESKMGTDVPAVAGSVGVNLFQGGCLVLDLHEGRAAFSAHAPRLDGVKVPVSLVGGRPVFQVDGAVTLQVMYDTGASAFGLVCRPELFASLVGPDAGWTLPVTVAGGVGDLRGARIELDLIVGKEILRLSEIYTIELMDLLYDSTKGQIEAIAGNEMFRGRIVAVDFPGKVLIVGRPASGGDRP